MLYSALIPAYLFQLPDKIIKKVFIPKGLKLNFQMNHNEISKQDKYCFDQKNSWASLINIQENARGNTL